MLDIPLDQALTLAAAFLGAGAAAGLLAGLLGVGGGIVIVPVTIEVLTLIGVDPAVVVHLAVGTSLATIVPTALSSARSHHRRGGVDTDLLKALAPAVLVGAVLGGIVADRSPGAVLTAVFGTIGMIAALNMLARSNARPVRDGLPGVAGRIGIGGVIGGVSSMMGIGGGTLTVPILSACNVPARTAVGTSAAVGLFIAVPGAITFILTGLDAEGLPPGSLGYVNWIALALIVPMTILIAPVGAKIAHSIPPVVLKRVFAAFLVIVSLRLLWRAFG